MTAAAQIAARSPHRSAVTPPTTAPTAYPTVSPQPIDADRAGSPEWVGDVPDCGQQGGIDHGGAGAQQPRRSKPPQEGVARRDHRQPAGLGEHPRSDQMLATPPVGQRAR